MSNIAEDRKQEITAHQPHASSPQKNQENAISWIHTDGKFVKFLVGDLFTSGIHVWWFVGVFSIISVAFIFLTFFAGIVDANYLFSTCRQFSDEDRRRLYEYETLRGLFNMEYPTLRQLATLSQARHLLGNPYLSYPAQENKELSQHHISAPLLRVDKIA